MRPAVGSKCKALSHGRAMCWPVREGKWESKDRSRSGNNIIIRRDGSGSCNRSGPEPIRFRLAVA